MNFFRKKATVEDKGLVASEPPLFDEADDGALWPDDPYEELGIPRDMAIPTPPDPHATGPIEVEQAAPARQRQWSRQQQDAPPVAETAPSDRGPFVARSRLAAHVPSTPVPRRIWDIEAERPPVPSRPVAPDPETMADGMSIEAPDPEDDVALARAQIARFSEAGLTGAGASAGRAKTRVLGFQAAAFGESDPFAGDAPRGGRTLPAFPVGWIVVIEGPGRGASFTLTSGVSSIGRGEDQTICLDYGDTSISRQNHASIAFDEEVNRFFLGQGGKSNIVRLNNRPVLSTEDLNGGDTIRIGETTLRLVAFCGEGFEWTDNDTSQEGIDAASE